MKKVSIRYFFISLALYALAANFAHPVEPTFYQDLNMPDYVFGVAFAAMAFSNFFFAPFWSNVSSRIGIAKTMVIGYLGYAFGQFFFLISKTVWEIVLARLFAGFFIAALSDMNILYILAEEKKEKVGTSLAYSATISAVFTAFGYFIGGVIGNEHASYAIIAQIVVLALTGLWIFLFLDDSGTHETEKQSINPFSAFAGMKSIMSKQLIVFLILVAVTCFATCCYDNAFNYFIKDQFGFKPSMNGLLKGAVGLITLLANATVCVWLLKKTDIVKALIPVLAICFVMSLGIVCLQDLIPFIVLNVIFFSCNAIYKPLLQAMIDTFGKDHKAVTVGAYNSIGSIGTIAGSLTAGFVYEISPRMSFTVTAVSFAIAVGLAVWQYRLKSN